MTLALIIVAAVAAWVYMGLVCYRWDGYCNGREAAVLPLDLTLWWLAVPMLLLTRSPKLPAQPWLPWDPPTLVSAAEYSLMMEKEAGLRFDGVFLKEDYKEF